MSADVVVNATADQVSEFLESVLWKDIRRELLIWRRNAEKEYQFIVTRCMDGEGNSASVLTNLGSIKGRCEAIDYLLNLPSVFLQIKEEQAAEKKGEL